jgi:thymidine kinase
MILLKPTLIVNTGSMFSGKSTELLKQGELYERLGARIIFLKPSLDKRYSESAIVTHNGARVKSLTVDKDANLLEIQELREADVILIDEVQFFNHTAVVYIKKLVDYYDKVVVASGLDLDFQGMAFNVTASLMAYADVVNKFKTICRKCGAPAYVSARKSDDNTLVKLGGAEEYEPICRSCFKKHIELKEIIKEAF